MAGNELAVCKFLLANKSHLTLNHLGAIATISTPVKGSNSLVNINSQKDLALISTQDSRKKADIYLNGSGVSIKQTGGSFAFNRIQRANIKALYQQLGFTNISSKLALIDLDVNRFHQGLLTSRNVSWQNYLSSPDFQKLLKYLMLIGSPNQGISKYPAQYILEAPASGINQNNLNLYSFNQYFNLYKHSLTIAIRRQWVGQKSKSEHNRALSLSKKRDNLPWVFNKVVGQPRTGWQIDFSVSERRTVYFLMIEKK